MKRYFAGEKVDFNKVKIDLSWATEFQKKVYKEVLKIKYGKVATYKQIARRIGVPNAYRAVGRALAQNKLPIIIPCHRVIRADGTIGSYKLSKKMKKFLLEFEKRHSK